MSEQDPRRMLEGGASQEAGGLRSLLEAGKSEVPSDRQMMLLAAKIGILGGLGGAGAAGAGAGAGGGKAATGAAGALKAGLAVKVIGAVAIASAAGAGAVAVSNRSAEPVAPVGLVAAEVASATGVANANADAAASVEVEVEVEVAEDAGAKVSGAKVRPLNSANVATAAVASEGPEAEVKLVQRAQDALRSRPDESLALCNEHAKRFPNGMVSQECEVIAIEALVKTGRKEEARKRAARFKTRFPGSAALRRLDVLLAD